MAAPNSDQTSGQGGGSSFLPLILALILMPGVAYLTFKYMPGIQKARAEFARAGTNQPSGMAASPAKKKQQQIAQPNMPVPLANGRLGFHPDVGKRPGQNRLVLTNAPNVHTFDLALKLADSNKPRYAMMEIFMIAENTDELIAKANLNQPKLFESFTNLLSNKTANQLMKPGGRNILRAELVALCNQVLGPDTVSEILIQTLLVQ